jgi:uncharacterized membrane protein YhiD involved in acid resistance
MPTYAIWVGMGSGIYFQAIFLAVVLFCYVDWDAIPALDSDEADIEFVRANSMTQKEDNGNQGSIVENSITQKEDNGNQGSIVENSITQKDDNGNQGRIVVNSL